MSKPASISIKDYVDAQRSGQMVLTAVLVLGFAAVIVTLDRKNGEAVKLALTGQEEATKVALAAASEKGVHHNGLIDRMREMSAQFITRGNLYSALIAAGTVAGIYAVFTP